MKIVARVKDKGITCGYIIKLDDGTERYENTTSINRYNPQNAVRLNSGEWKAKNGCSIKTVDKSSIPLTINNRNTPLVGKPKLIYNYSFGKLSKTQQILLNKFQTTETENVICIDKRKDNMNVTMKDLSALTAATGVEYSLFSRNDKLIIVRGTQRGMDLDAKFAAKLLNNKYTWTGHTHPGNTNLCLIPSEADYSTLEYFNQSQSMIYNSVGDYHLFGKGGLSNETK